MTPEEAVEIETGDTRTEEVADARRFTFARAAAAVFAFTMAIDALPIAGLGSAATLAGPLFFAAALIHVMRTRRVRAPPPAVQLMTAFVAWAALSITWARTPEDASYALLTYAQLLLFLWLGWQLTRTSHDWRALAGGFVAGCVAAAIGTWLANRAGIINNPDDEYSVRFSAFGFDPNDMAVRLAIAIPIAVHLAVTARGIWRAIWLAYVPLAMTAIVLSGSRGGLIATAAALVTATFVALHSKARLAIPLAGFIAAGVAGALVWVPFETWERFFTLQDQLSGGTLSGRTVIWRAGFDVFAKHPFIGIGCDGFGQAVVPTLGGEITAHNTPLKVATEFGVVGLALFLGGFAAAVRASLSNRLSRVLVPGLVATWFVGAASLSWSRTKVTWFVLLLATAAAALEDAPAPPAEQEHPPPLP